MPLLPAPTEGDARRVVLTGGPGSGKTTLVEHFRRQGYPAVPEAALQIIQELIAELGLERQKSWRKDHVAEFQERILSRQIRLESAIASGDAPYVFLDRGRLDGLAYFRLSAVPAPLAMRAAMLARRYEHVFILETLPDYDARPESGRSTESYADSLRIRQALCQAYQDSGYEPIVLPVLSVEERARFVLEHLARGGVRPQTGVPNRSCAKPTP